MCLCSASVYFSDRATARGDCGGGGRRRRRRSWTLMQAFGIVEFLRILCTSGHVYSRTLVLYRRHFSCYFLSFFK